MIKKSIILFAHGSRRLSWRQPFDNLLEKMREMNPDAIIELAFLELMQPSLDDTLSKIIQTHNCKDITICPIFLGKGGHIERDLINIIDKFKLDNQVSDDINLKILPTIGERDSILNFIAQDIFSQI
jgi:sirohydrochlorin cobaltochelatase